MSCKGNCRSGSREDVYWSDGWNVGWIILLDRLILKWGTFKRLLMCSCQSASPIRVCVLWLLESLSAMGLMQWERNKVIRTGGAHCEHVRFDLERNPGMGERAKNSQSSYQILFLYTHRHTWYFRCCVYLKDRWNWLLCFLCNEPQHLPMWHQVLPCVWLSAQYEISFS